MVKFLNYLEIYARMETVRDKFLANDKIILGGIMAIENGKKVKKGMILAGGLGTRFLPATLCLAKELFPIGNKPIIMYHLEDLVKAGVEDVLIVGNKLKEESFKQFLCPSEEYISKVESDGKLGLLEDCLYALPRAPRSHRSCLLRTARQSREQVRA